MKPNGANQQLGQSRAAVLVASTVQRDTGASGKGSDADHECYIRYLIRNPTVDGGIPDCCVPINNSDTILLRARQRRK